MTKSAYDRLGVSATKEEVHEAVAQTDPGLFPGAFCRIGEDALGGDPDWCGALHTDDAGTKTLIAYLRFRETGDPTVFRSLAQDALVMNLDDLACIGATDRFLLCNAIERNSFHIPGAAVREIVAGYIQSLLNLEASGIRIVSTGGETADLVDTVRTLVVGCTLATRLPRSQVIDNARIEPGDVIVGLSSTGQATYEAHPNSGIGSNGLTLARHALLRKEYGQRYPESLAPEIDPALAYRGPFALDDRPDGLKTDIASALASPTRYYAPILKEAFRELGAGVHGVVHNTGGGQTKCKSFGAGIRYRKDDLFPIPPLFSLIAQHGAVPWSEMYQTFNMGHRMELFLSPRSADALIAISRRFAVEARIVGRCEASKTNEVLIESPHGAFHY